jgi:hypothetical protein
VTAANIHRHRTRFLFLQNPDDLLIAEPAAFHSSVPLRNRLYRNLETFQGGTSNRRRWVRVDVFNDMTIMRHLHDVFACQVAGHQRNFRCAEIAGHPDFN